MVDQAEALFEAMTGARHGLLGRLADSGRGERVVLADLSDKAEPVRPSDLAASVGLSNPRVSAALASLEAKGQVSRAIDPANRRQVLVTITGAGLQRAAAERAEALRELRAVLVRMDDADVRDFTRLFARFTELAADE
ncbi:MAG: MarR family transcriptional regulator [Bifidobacteriaceae bacterium]|nr:MarR family transcriptional regulator [Bifidobacteriaceae bacterium]